MTREEVLAAIRTGVQDLVDHPPVHGPSGPSTNWMLEAIAHLLAMVDSLAEIMQGDPPYEEL